MTATYDVCVVGLGGMGSAALKHCSEQGAKVLGIEQFPLGHDQGSSHGESRLIRQVYFEHPNYVPLLKRAYQNWDKLSEEVGEALFQRTGVVIFCPASGGEVLDGMRESAKEHNLSLEVFPAKENPFPQFAVPDNFVGAFEKDAGYLLVEKCVHAHAKAATNLGAEIWDNTSVAAIQSQGSSFRVTTTKGDVSVKKVIVTAGPWMSQLLPELKEDLKVCRVSQFWFDAPDLASDGMPCFAFDYSDTGFFYGFPPLSHLGLKMAAHAPGEVLNQPEDRGDHVPAADVAAIEETANRIFPNHNLRIKNTKLCLYTMSTDEHFILDQSHAGGLTYLAGLSGHGFKFASVMGEALADLALEGKTDLPVDFLRRR